MERERGHETIEHTADMGISGWGQSGKEAFEEMALAMFELIVDGEGIAPRMSVDIRATGEDEEELLVDFLNNLLMRADIEELVFLDVEVKFMAGNHATREFFLKAVARGVPLDEVRDRLLREVKAVTYYGVSLGRDEKGNSRATVVVDL
jgi:SHS2 domain-containing protein